MESTSNAADAASAGLANQPKRNLWKAMKTTLKNGRATSMAEAPGTVATALYQAASPDGRVQLSRLARLKGQTSTAIKDLQDVVQAAELFSAALRRSNESMRSLLDESGVDGTVGRVAFYSIQDAQEKLLGLVQSSIEHSQEGISVFAEQISPAVDRAEALRTKMQEALTARENIASSVDNLAYSSKVDSQMKSVQLTNEHREAASAFSHHQTDTIAAVKQLSEEVRSALARALLDTVVAQAREVADVSRSLKVASDLISTAAVPKSFPRGGAGDSDRPGSASMSPLEATAAGLPEGRPRSASTVGTKPKESAASWAIATAIARVAPDSLLPAPSIPMLPGESLITRVEQVVDTSRGVPGTLVTTNYRIRWFPAGYSVSTGSADSPLATTARASGFASAVAAAVAADRSSARAQDDGGTPRAVPAASSAVPGTRAGRADSSFDLTAVLIPRAAVPAELSASSSGSLASPQAGSTTAVVTAPQHARSHYRYDQSKYVSIPLLSIARMDVIGGPRGVLCIGCSDMRVINFSFGLTDADPENVISMLADHVWIKEPAFPAKYLSALIASGEWPSPSRWPVDGWTIYDIRREFDRCAAASGVAPASIRLAVMSTNSSYKLCGTYPDTLILPTSIPESAIVAAAKFRSKHRLPAVTWFRGSVTLSRASQPLAGVFAARSGDDERLICALAADSPAAVVVSTGSKGERLCIVDARPRLNAAANAAKGGGTETIGNYPNCTLEFLNIDNIHVVRDALAALRGYVLREARRALIARFEAQHAAHAVVGTRGGGLAAIAALAASASGVHLSALGDNQRSSNRFSFADMGGGADTTYTGLGGLDDDVVSGPGRMTSVSFAEGLNGNLGDRMASFSLPGHLYSSGSGSGLHDASDGPEHSPVDLALAALDDDDDDDVEEDVTDDPDGRKAGSAAGPGTGEQRASRGSIGSFTASLTGRKSSEALVPQRQAVVDYAGPSGNTATPLSPAYATGISQHAPATNAPAPADTDAAAARRARMRAMGAEVGGGSTGSLAATPRLETSAGSAAAGTSGAGAPVPSTPDRSGGKHSEGGQGSTAQVPATVPATPPHGGHAANGHGHAAGHAHALSPGMDHAAQHRAHYHGQHAEQYVPAPGLPHETTPSHGGPQNAHSSTVTSVEYLESPAHSASHGHGHGPSGGTTRTRRGSISHAVSGWLFSTKSFLAALQGRRGKKGLSSKNKGGMGTPAGKGDGHAHATGTPDSHASGEGLRAGGLTSPTLGHGQAGSGSGNGTGGSGKPGEEGHEQHTGVEERRMSSRVRPGALVWLKLTSIQLEGGVKVAKKLLSGISVLVHCSDGWDRTSALTSLAQLMLDPHARTIDGFAVLVEKEWVSFGHRFGRRNGTGGCGHDRADHGDGQRAPIFLQWLDCVWQMLRQCPSAYEFSEALLVMLAEHAYSGRFGTFLMDCQRDRAAAKLQERTMSIWTALLHPSRRQDITNPSYAPPVATAALTPAAGSDAAVLVASPGAGQGAGMGLVPVFPVTEPTALAIWPYWGVKWAV